MTQSTTAGTAASPYPKRAQRLPDFARLWFVTLTSKPCFEKQAEYANDGKSIPDFAHLWQTETEFRDTLYKSKLANCPPLIDNIVSQVG